MRAVITGSSGRLGRALHAVARARGWDVLAPSRGELDIRDGEAVWGAMRAAAPDVVFNCAAISHVDWAEDHPTEALAVNRDGARNVAEAAAGVGALLLHISTDYVFGGGKGEPYLPTDPPDPRNVYGSSKLAGEIAVEDSGARYLILRTSWLFGEGSGGFVDAIRRRLSDGGASSPIQVVEDEVSRPTWITDLAPALLELAERGERGYLHLANSGHCSRLELAREIRAFLLRSDPPPESGGSLPDLQPVSSEAFGASARRPLYSVLDLTAAEEVLGRRLPDWQDALRRFLQS